MAISYAESYVKPTVWSTDVIERDYRKGFVVLVPEKILLLMKRIDEEFQHIEVGLYIKAEINSESMTVKVSEDVYILS